MKVKNKNNYGKTVRFGNTEVKISEKGFLETKTEVEAKKIYKEYPNAFFDETIKVEEPKEIEKGDVVSIREIKLQEKLDYSNRIIDGLKSEINEKDISIKTFKDLAVKLELELKELKVAKQEETNGATNGVVKEEEAVKESVKTPEEIMKKRTQTQLKEICEKMGLPKNEWGSLSKAKLVAYLLENTK